MRLMLRFPSQHVCAADSWQCTQCLLFNVFMTSLNKRSGVASELFHPSRLRARCICSDISSLRRLSVLNFLCRRQGFSNRQGGRANGSANPTQQRSQNGSPTTGNPSSIPANAPAQFPATTGPNTHENSQSGGDELSEPPKFFFMVEHAKLGVKGNMHPLAAKPIYLDLADWLAHQSECLCATFAGNHLIRGMI